MTDYTVKVAVTAQLTILLDNENKTAADVRIWLNRECAVGIEDLYASRGHGLEVLAVHEVEVRED